MTQNKLPKNNSQTLATDPNEQAPIPIDGFQQVLDMLRIADPAFRESLLKRLAVRDQALANSLRKDLRRTLG